MAIRLVAAQVGSAEEIESQVGMGVRAISVAVAALLSVLAPAAESVAAPSPSPRPSAVPAPAYCPLAVSVSDLDGTHTRYVVALSSFEPGRASGVVSLYAGNRRYDVPFRDAVARAMDDERSRATPIVVHFLTPTTLDGGVVTSIEDPTTAPCDPPFSPWLAVASAGPQTAEDRRRHADLLALARVATPVEAPAPIDDPVACTTPSEAARTVHAFQPTNPYRSGSGTAHVLVVLGPDDRVLGVKIGKSAGDIMLDRVALHAAAHSEFRAAVFRCRPVAGVYQFDVTFLP